MTHTPQVLVVDDDPEMCAVLEACLAARGYGARAVTNGDEALRRFQAERPSAVLLDIVMPGGMDGLAALAAFKQIDRDVPVIVLSGHGATETVVQAMKLGAADFVCKPFDVHALELLIDGAVRQRELTQQVATLRGRLTGHARGHSDRMVEVFELLERVSDTDVTVLIRGESGTGKELVARALHERSLRRERPFVKVNCAALPTELLESELFGFERGAFTGALQQKPGKFEFADQGTMFLDEIGDISYPLQAKLLQVLQDGEFSRLGGKADVRVDVRLIAATNRHLETAVAAGQFREDLYFRLNVVTIDLPPLRERREEIPILTDHFLHKYAAQYHKPAAGLSAELSRQFAEYDWPGNIRQLENMVKRIVVLGTESGVAQELMQPARAVSSLRAVTEAPADDDAPASDTPGAAGAPDSPPVSEATNGDEPASRPAAAPAAVSLKEIGRAAAREAECELILRMLTRTRWNRKEAAQILGVSYKALLYKIKENGLDRAS